MDRFDGQFLLIVGAQKAGTTSLYRYFCGHPQIDACTIKEPCYFLPRDYSVPSKVRQGRDGLDQYLNLFRRTGPATLMEATATYLHIPGAAALIKAALPHARIVISLREPVSRLISWYRMVRLFGVIDDGLSFDDYVQTMLDDPRPVSERPHEWRAVEHGRYAPYLAEYLQAFGRERVFVTWARDLQSDPLRVVRQICAFADLDPNYFDDFDFREYFGARQPRNRSVMNAYRAIKLRVRDMLPADGMLYRHLHRVAKGFIEPRVITRNADKVAPSEHVLQQLRAIYASDRLQLQAALGAEPPW